jgi:hypothetical protein
MTFDDLPTLSIGEGYVQLHVPGTVAIDGRPPILVTRIVTMRPADCEKLSAKLMKCAAIAREIGPEEPKE